jgi:hypothetical protein
MCEKSGLRQKREPFAPFFIAFLCDVLFLNLLFAANPVNAEPRRIIVATWGNLCEL